MIKVYYILLTLIFSIISIQYFLDVFYRYELEIGLFRDPYFVLITGIPIMIMQTISAKRVIKIINFILFIAASIGIFLILMLTSPGSGLKIFMVAILIILINLLINAVLNSRERFITLVHLTLPILQLLILYTGIYHLAGFDIYLSAQYLLMMIIAFITGIFLYRSKNIARI